MLNGFGVSPDTARRNGMGTAICESLLSPLLSSNCFTSACTSRSSRYACCSCAMRCGLGSVRGRETKGPESSRGVTSCGRLEAQVSYCRCVDSGCAIPADDGKDDDSENESTVTSRR